MVVVDGIPDSGSLEAFSAQRLREIYALLSECAAIPEVDAGYRHLLQRVLDAAFAAEQGPMSFALLPLLTCQATGGKYQHALPVAAAWRALHIAARLLDDIQDNELPQDSDHQRGIAQSLNLATGFMTIAGLALSWLTGDVASAVQSDFQRAILRIAGGQHADLGRSRDMTLERAFQIIEAKSAACFALASRAGTRCGTSDLLELTRYDRFGHNVGMMIQIADDLDGIRRPLGRSDIAAGHCSLPVIYALSVASPPERERLAALLARAPGDIDAERDARQLMVSLGAEVYLMVERQRYRRQAMAVLDSVDQQSYDVTPLREWLAALSAPPCLPPGPLRA
jgi:geranylgeranyl pyrophosphate synthase